MGLTSDWPEEGSVGLRCGRNWKDHSDDPALLLCHSGTTSTQLTARTMSHESCSLFNHRCLGRRGLGYFTMNGFGSVSYTSNYAVDRVPSIRQQFGHRLVLSKSNIRINQYFPSFEETGPCQSFVLIFF